MKTVFASALALVVCLLGGACGPSSAPVLDEDAGAEQCGVPAGIAPEQFVTSDKCGAPAIVNDAAPEPYEPAPGSGGAIPAGVYDVVGYSGQYDEIPGLERLLVFSDGRFARTRNFSYPGFKGTGPRYTERSSGRLVTAESTLTFEKDCSWVTSETGKDPIPKLPSTESWDYGVLFKCGGPVVLRRDRETQNPAAPTSVIYVRR